MIYLRVLLAILAVFRLARMIAYEFGPLMVFEKFRGYMASRAAGKTTGGWAWSFAELVSCPYCLGLWLSIPAALMVIYPTTPTDIILLIFGISGGQAFLMGVQK